MSAALGRASLDDVLRMWAGLGYYSRARNLHACAVAVLRDHGGRFPTPRRACALPGIGPYTAAAIAAIAFDRRTMPVDGNIERVVSRLFAVEEPLPQAKPLIQQLAATLLDAGDEKSRAGDSAAGADGSRLLDLHAEEAGLRAVPAERRIARHARAAIRRPFRARRRRRPARCAGARPSSSPRGDELLVRTRRKRACSAA